MANLILYIHFVIFLGIVIPVPLIVIGYFAGWRFIRHPWFRVIHAGVFALVLLFHFTMGLCPLTVWEQAMRQPAAQPESIFYTIAAGVLYWDWPLWVFTLIYVGFGILILYLLVWIPPHFQKHKNNNPNSTV
ncbi:DUF2784 family protein [bacterium]|nr:DUF2784 family protein [bacterium]